MDKNTEIKQIEQSLANLADDVFKVLVARSALRALTGFVNLSNVSIEVARRDWVGTPDVTTFPALRAALSAVVALKHPTNQMRRVAYSSADWADAAPTAKGTHPGSYAANAARSISGNLEARPSSGSFVYDVYSHQDIGYLYLERDIQKFESISNLNNILNSPIWIADEPNGFNVSSDALFIGIYPDGIPERWSFWREWYQGFLDGKPLDLELQKEIALIPDADWEKGPEWIAGLIEVIRKRRDLEAEIAKLKENLEKAEAIAVVPNRLHNQPPEAVDDPAQMIVGEITLVWAQIEELEKEVAKPSPSRTILVRIAKWLADTAVKVAKYCVSLGDIALKSIAKWAGPVVITKELAAPGTLQSVSKAILEFVKTLPPG